MTTRPTPQFNLSLEEAIEVLDEQVKKNRQQTKSGQQTPGLQGMSVDQAYDIGYETLLHDLKSLTGPDPFEVHAVVATEIGLVDLGALEEDPSIETKEKN